jgi:hypothetical protein
VKKKHENFLDGEKAVLRGKFINIFVDWLEKSSYLNSINEVSTLWNQRNKNNVSLEQAEVK